MMTFYQELSFYAIIVIFLLPVAGRAQASPRIVFNEVSHNVGTLPQHSKKHFAYTFTNMGTGILNISRIDSGCGCTTIRLEKDRYEPNQTGKLDVTFDSQNYRGDLVRYIRVHSNDPDNPVVTLRVSAHIIEEIALRPETLAFGEIRLGEPANAKVRVFSPNGKEFNITEIRPTLDFLCTALTSDGEGNYILYVSLDKPPAGTFAGTIVMETDMESMPEIRLAVSGHVRSVVEAHPRRIFFGSVPSGSSPSREVVLRPGDAISMKIESVQTTERLEASIIVAEGHELKLNVSIADSAKQGMLNGEVTVSLSRPAGVVVKVPVYAIVSEGK